MKKLTLILEIGHIAKPIVKEILSLQKRMLFNTFLVSISTNGNFNKRVEMYTSNKKDFKVSPQVKTEYYYFIYELSKILDKHDIDFCFAGGEKCPTTFTDIITDKK